jgi:hypothetical protein
MPQPRTVPLLPKNLVAFVERSPQFVAAHDREKWLGLFAETALIEDPVGSPPAPKAGGMLGAFWDTFIAPHQIQFEIRRDYAIGRDLFRDALIHTRIGRSIRIDVPAYILYQVDDASGGLQVWRMAAHWQLTRLSLAALKLGPRAWVAMTVLFGRMLRRMGPSWVGGYVGAFWNGIGRAGLSAVARLQRAIETRNPEALPELFTDDAEIEIGTTTATARQLFSLLAPGSRLEVEAPVTAGFSVSFRFTLDGPTPRARLALLEFVPGTRKIGRARFFVDAV